MSTYDELLAAPCRTPIWLVILTLDFCENTFGVSPCTATGEPCYNTYCTCRDKLNFVRGTKDYMYTNFNAPLPFPGPRRLISSLDFYPTEIKTSLTVRNRIKVGFVDEIENDIGIDPYVASRDSVQGTHFKKLIARNEGSYKGRPFKAYHGFLGMTLAEFLSQEEHLLALDNIKIDSGGGITVEAVDLLAKLSDTYIPPKLAIKLMADIAVLTSGTLTVGETYRIDTYVTGDDFTNVGAASNESGVEFEATGTTPTTWTNESSLRATGSATLSDTSDLPASGYVRIGDEVIGYASKNDTTNQIIGLTFAAYDTEPEEHSVKDKVTLCYLFAPDNPYEHAKTILSEADIASANVDTAAYDALEAFPEPDIDYWAIVTKPTKADTLYFELMKHLDCKSWVNENLKVTVSKGSLPNLPGRTYTDITDDGNIVTKTGEIDLNQDSQVTRYYLFYDLVTNGSMEEPDDFDSVAVSPDAEAESENELDKAVEEVIYSRWIHTDPPGYTEEEFEEYVELLVSRLTRAHRDALHLVPLSVELKDAGLKTGHYVRLASDIMQNPDGTALSYAPHQVVKREPKDSSMIALTLMAVPKKRIAYWADDALPDYDDATQDEREYGFWADDAGYMSDRSPGYHWY
jgi:hypothetical protein